MLLPNRQRRVRWVDETTSQPLMNEMQYSTAPTDLCATSAQLCAAAPCGGCRKYRIRLRPDRIALAFSVALLGCAVLVKDVFLGFRPDLRGGGILSEDLLRQLAEIRTSPPEPEAVGDKTVAFMFLTDGDIVEQELWQEWFEASSSGDWRAKANIYVHVKNDEASELYGGGDESSGISPRTILPDLGPFFCPRVIPSVRTKKFFLHHAMMQLLLRAYMNPSNAYFVFISDASIPVKSFDDVYEELIGEKHSRVCSAHDHEAEAVWDIMRNDPRTQSLLEKKPGMDRTAVGKGSLWSGYARRHVALLLSNAEAMAEWYGAYVDAPHHRYGAADEIMLPTLLRKAMEESGEDGLSSCHSDLPAKAAATIRTLKATIRTLPAPSTSTTTKRSLGHKTPPPENACCPTYEKWGIVSPASPYFLLAPDFASRQCSELPCLHEEIDIMSLQELSQAEHVLFMRKMAKNVKVKTKDGIKGLRDVLPGLLGYRGNRGYQLNWDKEGQGGTQGYTCRVNH